MALNKAQTSTITKVLLVLLILAFVASFVPLFGQVGQLFTGSGSVTTNTNDPTAAVNAQYQPQVNSLVGLLQSDPESYTVLVALGNTYFDWASAIQQASRTTTGSVGADRPIWVSAKDAYARAVAVKQGDAPVAIDYAVAAFYTGDTLLAIKTAEKVMTDQPDFAPAWFNGAIFYETLGETAKAIKAYETYIKLDPKGEQGNIQLAKDNLAKLKAAGGATGATGTIPATTAP